jgi:hypothetical protein
MLALTIWQPWASLIIAGGKPAEYRKWDYRTRYQLRPGDRIAIHAGRRRVDPREVEALLAALSRLAPSATRGRAYAVLHRARISPGDLLLSAVLGTALIGEPQRLHAIAAQTWLVRPPRTDELLWAWPLSDVQPFAEPVPAAGTPCFWRWPRPT